ncbi:transferase [Streptomyces griseocarneus]|nr:transferase [Streptomyces griseocarneus]
MRVGLLTEGGYPYAAGEGGQWCDQLVRGLGTHEFEIYALSRGARQERCGWYGLPEHVRRVRTAPLWGDPPEGLDGEGGAGGSYGKRERQRFGEHFTELAAAVAAMGAPPSDPLGDIGPTGAGGDQAYRFADALHGLADLTREVGGLGTALRSEQALRALEAACRAPGAHPAVYGTRVADLLAVSALLERALRPLSLDWYGACDSDRGLAGVDLCHATSAGPAALPGLLAKRFFGTPLLVTEYEVRLRAYYLNNAASAAGLSLPVRTLLSAFHRLLTAEVYRSADLVTPGDAQVRRWQERCGADRERLRTVPPGVDERPYEDVGEGVEGAVTDDGRTLVWAGGRTEPYLWEALGIVREAEPGVRLRVIGAPQDGRQPPEGVLFDENPSPESYAAGSAVLTGPADGFPLPLVEAMFCGRATVSPDTGTVREIIGGTGLVVPPRAARELADACLALLRDPERRARLGAAARARALELFTVERHVTAFGALYLELISHAPPREDAPADPSVPFGRAAGAPAPVSLSARPAPTWAGRR